MQKKQCKNFLWVHSLHRRCNKHRENHNHDNQKDSDHFYWLTFQRTPVEERIDYYCQEFCGLKCCNWDSYSLSHRWDSQRDKFGMCCLKEWGRNAADTPRDKWKKLRNYLCCTGGRQKLRSSEGSWVNIDRWQRRCFRKIQAKGCISSCWAIDGRLLSCRWDSFHQFHRWDSRKDKKHNFVRWDSTFKRRLSMLLLRSRVNTLKDIYCWCWRCSRKSQEEARILKLWYWAVEKH